MNTICNYTGGINAWSLPQLTTNQTQLIFKGVPNCCNQIIVTNSTGHLNPNLKVTFEQLGENNQILNKVIKQIAAFGAWAGLSGSQITASVTQDSLIRNSTTSGLQKYVNCSDAKNIVPWTKSKKPKNLPSPEIWVLLSALFITLIGTIIYHLIKLSPFKKQNGYSEFNDTLV